MTIHSQGSLHFSMIHVTNGTKGFYPYTVAIKETGTFIEGNFGHLLHISLHHQPKQNNSSLSQCHLTIPREIESQVIKQGFDSRQYCKWDRQRSINGQNFYQACRLIFPSIFATEEYCTVAETTARKKIIPLRDNATIIEFWYGSSTEEKLGEYLDSFGNSIITLKIKNSSEVIGINSTYDESRDYSIYQRHNNFGSYTITDTPNPIINSESKLTVGPHGENCYSILHGNPCCVRA